MSRLLGPGEKSGQIYRPFPRWSDELVLCVVVLLRWGRKNMRNLSKQKLTTLEIGGFLAKAKTPMKDSYRDKDCERLI